MKKLRSNSTWAKLKPEQVAVLDAWLFDENLNYESILDRVEHEFGIQASMGSLSHYRARRSVERQIHGLVGAHARANAINAMQLNMDAIRSAAVNLIGSNILDITLNQPGAYKELASLTRVLVDNADVEDRRARTRLAEQKLKQESFAASEQSLSRFKRLVVDIQTDESLTEAEKGKKIRELFENIPVDPFRD